MRILFLTETLKWGGAELFTLRLANAIGKINDNSVVVVNLHQDLVSPTLLAEFAQLKIYHFNPFADYFLRKIDRLLLHVKIDYSFRQVVLSRYIKKIVNRYDISVVHSHLFKVDYAFAQINRQLKLAHVITNHGDYQLFYKKGTNSSQLDILNFDRKAQFVFKNVSSICCISHKQVDHIENTYGAALLSKLQLIYNGFEIKPVASRKRSELSISENNFVIGMVARGIIEKGWDYLLAAFNMLNNKNMHLILVGDGEFFSSRQHELRSNDNIHWVGYSSNPAEWIPIFDIGVLPSYYDAESQPSVVFEYLAMGKPVICSDVGDVDMVLNANTEKKCGYTLRLGDKSPFIDVIELKNYIDQYYKDNALKELHSKNATLRFDDFKMSRCAEQYWNEYKKLI